MTAAPARVLVVWSSDSTPDLADRLVRVEAARWLGVGEDELRLLRLCPSCGSSGHGRPLLAPIRGLTVPHVSISRADRVSLVALCDAGPVGVDVERKGSAGFDRFADVGLHPSEGATTARARTVTWVRKESLLKASGHGLGVDPRRIRLTGPSEPPALVDWSAPRPPGSAWMFDVGTLRSHVAAVTVLAATAPELVVRPSAQAARARPASGGRAPRADGRRAPRPAR